MKSGKIILSVVLTAMLLVSCRDWSSRRELFGLWINRNVGETEYHNKLLLLGEPTEEMKKDLKNSYDGIYKIGYVIDRHVVEDSVVTGKWKFQSQWLKDRFGYVNGIELTPSDESKLPQTFQFYYDGSILRFIDQTTEVPRVESFTTCTFIKF